MKPKLVLGLALVLGACGVGCSSVERPRAKTSPGATVPADSTNLPVIIIDPEGRMVQKLALEQLQPSRARLMVEIPDGVSSLEQGLPFARKASGFPIVAATAYQGWFFYAYSVVKDGETFQPVQFLAGYAIKRGGRQILHWSVW
jgi:hypothetical protein